jgi:chorismate mutase
MAVRAIRGAITVKENTQEAILEATTDLLRGVLQANPTVQVIDLIGAWFSATSDLNAVYPARAARELGWLDVPMMCAQEMDVAGSLPRCIRVLLMFNSRLQVKELTHVYVGQAAELRPDWGNRSLIDVEKGDLR